MRLSDHFTLEELIFSQTAARDNIDNTPSEETIKNLTRTCGLLEQVRKAVARPIVITSGYRSPELNRMIGGKPTSQHCMGCAADIKVNSMSIDDLMNAIIAADLDYDQCIHEFNSWVHISVPSRNGGIPRKEKLVIDHNGTRKYEP